jgi:hypothetical protein
LESSDVFVLCPALALAYSPADAAGAVLALAGPAARVAFWLLVCAAVVLCVACIPSVIWRALKCVERARARARALAHPAAVAYHGTSLEAAPAVRAGGWLRTSASLHTALARAQAAGAAQAGAGPGREGHGVVFRLEEYPGPRARVTAVLFTDTARAQQLGYAARGGAVVRAEGPGGARGARGRAPTAFYHGTPALENVLAIQKQGFDVGRAGANAGAMLGAGVYVTTSLQKAMNYAREDGAVFRLEVDLGRCAKLESTCELRTWQARFDSAWAPRGLIGEREENCVRDPRRVRVADVLLVAPAAAARASWRVVDRRLRWC